MGTDAVKVEIPRVRLVGLDVKRRVRELIDAVDLAEVETLRALESVARPQRRWKKTVIDVLTPEGKQKRREERMFVDNLDRSDWP